MATKKAPAKKPPVKKNSKNSRPHAKGMKVSHASRESPRKAAKARAPAKKPVKKAATKKQEKNQESIEETPKSNTKKRIALFLAAAFIILVLFTVFNYLDFNKGEDTQVETGVFVSVNNYITQIFNSGSSEDIRPADITPTNTPITPTGPAIELGDTVAVNYIGSFIDGEIFDTSYEQVAKDNDLYAEGRSYEPLTFMVGAGQMIQGFDNAVVAMKVGETKTVTLPPEEAYGPKDPSMIINISTVIDRMVYLARQFEIPSEDFENVFLKEPVINDTLSYELFPWNFSVVAIGSENITLEYLIDVGDEIILPQTTWNSTATAKNETTITIMQNPGEGQTIQTLFGPAEITATADKIHIGIDVTEGQEITTMYGVGLITAVYEDTITIDLNSKMAGKTLIFEITVENITKPDVQPATDNDES